MKILKYVVIALLTLGVITPATSLFAADSTNKVGTADSGKKKDKKTTKKSKKKNDGSTDASTDANANK